MMELPKPDIIFTHESDLDGLVAGLMLQKLAKKLYNRDVPLEAHHYNYWKTRELREKAAWVTDFSYEPRLDKEQWVIIDHHVTDSTPKNAHLIHDVTKSAGLLCYELCKRNGLDSPALERLAHLNNVADLFLENDPDFVLAGDYSSLVKVYQFWNLHALIDGDVEKLLDHPLLEVMAVKRRVEDPLGFEWSKNHVTEISPAVGYVETVVGNNNLIVHQLLQCASVKFPVLVTLFKRANNVVIASFRSRNGEALKVAEKFQGGGHANASGAMFPKSIRNIPEAVEYLRSILNPKRGAPLNNLESLFAGIEAEQRK
jgi:oligoribonuclease NrnB/cAMP/cGMP phosphodiesterase (DHH superfamily)